MFFSLPLFLFLSSSDLKVPSIPIYVKCVQKKNIKENKINQKKFIEIIKIDNDDNYESKTNWKEKIIVQKKKN